MLSLLKAGRATHQMKLSLISYPFSTRSGLPPTFAVSSVWERWERTSSLMISKSNPDRELTRFMCGEDLLACTFRLSVENRWGGRRGRESFFLSSHGILFFLCFIRSWTVCIFSSSFMAHLTSRPPPLPLGRTWRRQLHPIQTPIIHRNITTQYTISRTSSHSLCRSFPLIVTPVPNVILDWHEPRWRSLSMYLITSQVPSMTGLDLSPSFGTVDVHLHIL